MQITSFTFFAFLAANILCYYLFPKKERWLCLLGAGVIFFILSSGPAAGIYLLVCILVTHFCSVRISELRESSPRKAKHLLILGIGIDLSMLALLKYNGFFFLHVNAIASLLRLPPTIHGLNWLTPLGISFYTLQAIGMMADSLWGVIIPEKNLLKTALFIGYYPLLTSGPIARYGELSRELFSGHDFSLTNITRGLQRMLWGLFKKLVLSSRLAVIVNAVYADTEFYNGFYIWIAAALFMFQLYTDFSGCMDIIIGASETFGVRLPENFRTPFFSRSVQEFWQRWHISLGAFMRDYLMYPILRSGRWMKMTKSLKTRFGKKAARQIPAYLAMLAVWLVIGLWHGGAYKYIIGQGLWFCLCIIAEQAGEPLWKKLRELLRVRPDSFSLRLFQSLRTFFLVAFGNIFFRAGSLKAAVSAIRIGFTSEPNPWIFFDGSLSALGISSKEISLTFFGLILLLIVSLLQESGSVRDKISRQHIWFRWGIWFLLLFAVIVFGKYGPGYRAEDFIYRGF